MGDRYWVTGVQLGILTAVNENSVRSKIVDEVIDKQFIMNIENGQMKNFEEEIKLLRSRMLKKKMEDFI